MVNFEYIVFGVIETLDVMLNTNYICKLFLQDIAGIFDDVSTLKIDYTSNASGKSKLISFNFSLIHIVWLFFKYNLLLLLYKIYMFILIQANADNIDEVLNVKNQVKHKSNNQSKSRRKRDLSKLFFWG